MRRAFLFGLLLGACSPTKPPPVSCTGQPDFDIVITALDAPLPADTVVHVEYGGGEVEEYRLADPPTPQVLFCKIIDAEGNLVDAGAGGAGGSGGQSTSAGAGLGGDDGAGGAGAGTPVAGLRCQLWTYGPATVTVETALYPSTKPKELAAKKGTCNVKAEIELRPDDAGA